MVSHDVEVTEHRYEQDGKVVLAFRIAENPRTRKPVYLDGDIRRTFLRKGGGDYRALQSDIERLLRDATAARWDGQPSTRVALDEMFHPASLRWYRDRFHATHPGFDADQPHHEFLYDWGYLVKDGSELLPTRGAVALFGSLRGVRNLLPRPVLDTQFLSYSSRDDLPEMHWIDRVVSEVNLIETWQQLLAKYLPLSADKLLPWEEELISASLAPPLPTAPGRRTELDPYAPTGFRTALVDDDSGAIRLVPEPHEAAVVRELFLLYLTESGAQAVARTLSDRGHRMRDGQPWSKTAVLWQSWTAPRLREVSTKHSFPASMRARCHVSAPSLDDSSAADLVQAA